MKLSAKLLLPALSLPLLLAACDSASTGSGTVKFTDLKTEYRDSATGKSVACDNTTNLDNSTTKITSVGVYYTASGTISNLKIELLGNTTNSYNGNYSATVQGSNLQNIGGNNFKTVFSADAASGFLPQAIVVKPNADVNIKTVTTSGRVGGSNGGFYAKLTITSGNVSASANSTPVFSTIPVYEQCVVTAVTADKL